eukprot:CAMPEP_0117679814 /NCGR_PEP_ID=MMETSP0804-20121206/18010_1 /TAXON_ID=1074897 /ORGANISM="Tetraselmis astigmatica, Strain CCMP880" /LENGTH=808 /DNA_ID=CAMNT_0005489251 /DNA_START=325 /DNA_END=2751 /DNA_ORIENTATION=-
MMKSSWAALLVLLAMVGRAQPASGDFLGTLISSFAKSIFDSNGPTVQEEPLSGQPDVEAVMEGTGGKASLNTELDSIHDTLEAEYGQDPTDKQTEDVLEAQLAEDAVELEEGLAAEAQRLQAERVPEQQRKAALSAEEREAYNGMKQKVDNAEALEYQFATVEEMADAVAAKYGKDVEILVDDGHGHRYRVDSDLSSKDGMVFVPDDSTFAKDANQIVLSMKASGGSNLQANKASMQQWASEEQEAFLEAEEKVDQAVAESQGLLHDYEADGEISKAGEEAAEAELTEYQLQEQAAITNQYDTYKRLTPEEKQRMAALQQQEFAFVQQQAQQKLEESKAEHRAAPGSNLAGSAAVKEFAADALDANEDPSAPKVAKPAAGSKVAEGVVEAEDTTIAEGVKEGREAAPTELMSWDQLKQYEAAEKHSPRIRLQLSVLPNPEKSASMPTEIDDDYIRSVSACLVRDIEVAAGYYYSSSDTWEPGYGVYYNNTLVNEGGSSFSIHSESEVIYPSSYNPEDVERFLQRLMTVPKGIFSYTYIHHPEVIVTVENKIEYCSNDWTYWDFEGGEDNWEVSMQSERVNEKHDCWYQPKTHAQLVQWDMEDMWLLIGAMVVSGGMAVACVAALTKFCCEGESKPNYGEDDELLPMHRRHLIAQRLRGKQSERLWRMKQYLPHAKKTAKGPWDSEKDPLGAREKPHQEEDNKYSKKFSKPNKFSWVADYKSAHRLRKMAEENRVEASSSSCSSSDEAGDIPLSYTAPLSPASGDKEINFSEYFGQAAATPTRPSLARGNGSVPRSSTKRVETPSPKGD